jgi:hypothetical protein
MTRTAAAAVAVVGVVVVVVVPAVADDHPRDRGLRTRMTS